MRDHVTITHPELGEASVPAKTVPAYETAGWQSPDAVERPTPSAKKVAWVTFAVSQGMTLDDAESHTRDELANQFAPTEES